MLLAEGAKHVTTLEYNPITCTHPNVTTITPKELKQKYSQDPNYYQFDAVVSYSSLEHSGLGRYGDGLNPWGDLIAMAQTWCLTRNGGRALIGIPVGADAVIFNACKLYGPLQLSHLFANWKVVYTEAEMFVNGLDTAPEDRPKKEIWGYQPVFVLEKEIENSEKNEL